MIENLKDVYMTLSPGLRAALDAGKAKEGEWHTLSIQIKRTGETLDVINLVLVPTEKPDAVTP